MDGGGVGAGGGFGQAEGAKEFAGGERFEVAGFLGFGGEGEEGELDGRVGDGQGSGHGGVDAGYFFEHEDVRDHVEAGAAVGFGGEHTAAAEGTEFFDGLEGKVIGALPVLDVRADFVAHEVANGVADEELVIGEGEVHGCARVKFSMVGRVIRYQRSDIRKRAEAES